MVKKRMDNGLMVRDRYGRLILGQKVEFKVPVPDPVGDVASDLDNFDLGDLSLEAEFGLDEGIDDAIKERMVGVARDVHEDKTGVPLDEPGREHLIRVGMLTVEDLRSGRVPFNSKITLTHSFERPSLTWRTEFKVQFVGPDGNNYITHETYSITRVTLETGDISEAVIAAWISNNIERGYDLFIRGECDSDHLDTPDVLIKEMCRDELIRSPR